MIMIMIISGNLTQLKVLDIPPSLFSCCHRTLPQKMTTLKTLNLKKISVYVHYYSASNIADFLNTLPKTLEELILFRTTELDQTTWSKDFEKLPYKVIITVYIEKHLFISLILLEKQILHLEVPEINISYTIISLQVHLCRLDDIILEPSWMCDRNELLSHTLWLPPYNFAHNFSRIDLPVSKEC